MHGTNYHSTGNAGRDRALASFDSSLPFPLRSAFNPNPVYFSRSQSAATIGTGARARHRHGSIYDGATGRLPPRRALPPLH
eukprot:COSAG02_NODE_8181_length_2673_cov_1.366744_4_plen_81_part_00